MGNHMFLSRRQILSVLKVAIALVAVTFMVQAVFAGNGEEDLPSWFSLVFSAGFLANIAAVSGTAKLIRNALKGVKGVPAFIITLIVGIGGGLIQFTDDMGFLLALATGILGGLAATGVFRATKALDGKGFFKRA